MWYDNGMTEQLPDNISPGMHPYLMRLVRAYHTTPIPSRHELLLNQSEMPITEGWCSMKGIAEQQGITMEDRNQ